MQEKVNAKLVAFEDGGFRGDYTYGLRAVYSFGMSNTQRIVIKKKKRLIRSSVRRLVPTESVPTCGSYSS